MVRAKSGGGGARNPALRLGGVVACLGCLFTLLAALGLQRANERAVRVALETTATHSAEEVVRHVLHYRDGLRGLRGAVLAAGTDMRHEQLQRYWHSRNLTAEFAGSIGFGFVRWLPDDADLPAFERQMQAAGWPGYQVHGFAPNAGAHFVVQYIEPLESNRVALGLDLASEPNRRKAALEAALAGDARLTGPVSLPQQTLHVDSTLIMFLPVYRDGVQPEGETERMTQLLGWTYTPLDVVPMMQGLHLDPEQVDLQIRDLSQRGNAVAFYRNDRKAPAAIGTGVHVTREVLGRRWEMTFAPRPAFVVKLNLPSPLMMLAIGSGGSVLIGLLAGVVMHARRRSREVASGEANLLAVVQSSADGIIGKTLEGVVTNWNHAAELLFGYSAEQAIGRRLLDLIVPAELEHEEWSVLARISRGEFIRHFETVRRRADGSRVDVLVSVSPIRGADGRILGASKTVRDISAQKAAQAQVLALNATLESQVAERTEQLSKTNAMLQGVLAAATEVAIFATDLDGQVIVFNSGAERMLGYSSAEVVGVLHPRVFHAKDEMRARALELGRRYGEIVPPDKAYVFVPAREGSEVYECELVRKDGSKVAVTRVVTAMRDAAGATYGYLSIALDISERRRQREALTRAHDQLAMAAQAAQLGIWSWEPDSGVLECNERMWEMYQWSPSLREQTLHYADWRAKVHPEDIGATEEAMRLALRGLQPYAPIFRIRPAVGVIRHIHAGAYTERDADGQVTRVVGINRDITEQLALERQLREEKVRADAASEAKSSFLANMSHEIRTPMNAVLGMLQLLERSALDARQGDYVAKAQSAGRSLLALLNDVLDYSKIEAGKLQLDPHPFSVDVLLRDLGIVLSGNQAGKDIELVYRIAPDTPRCLVGDSLRLQQVLINLAGNAIKFTQAGHVLLDVAVVAREDDALRLRVAVEDTGIGISVEQRERIFHSFTQAEASISRRYGGTGLGLVICRRLVAMMGGELCVDSVPDRGSRFWFEVPLRVAPEDCEACTVERLPAPQRVLVVDDSALVREVLVNALLALGWRVDQAGGGAAAIAAAAQALAEGAPYDAVALDWRMPDMDGMDVARGLVALYPQGGRPRIVVTTGYGRELLDDLQAEPHWPFDEFLVKPVTPAQLAAALSGHRQGPAPSALPAYAALDGLHVLVVEDNALNRQVAAELLGSEGARVDLAEGGLEGVARVLEGHPVPDVVIMDMQMPDIDGLEATRRIRADGRFAALPILAMTANVAPADVQACLEAGMNAHIGKPVDLREMVEALRLLCPGRVAAAVQAPAAAAADEVATAGPIDGAALILARFGGDAALFTRMLGQFSLDAPTLVVRAAATWRSGEDAQTAAALHALKGTAATMGARQLAAASGELEATLKRGGQLADDCFEQLERDLDAALAALRACMAAAPAPAPATGRVHGAPGGSQVLERLQRLRQLLQDSNLEAVDIAAELREQVAGSVEAPYHTLLDQIEALRFDEASKTLDTLLEEGA